jgi:hypothetical protein
MGPVALSRGQSEGNMAWTTHPYVMARLRMGKAVNLFPLSAFMICYEDTFTFALWSVTREEEEEVGERDGICTNITSSLPKWGGGG